MTTLRCARCHRPLSTAYLCIGDLSLGRVCANRMGLEANKAHTLTTSRPSQARATEPDAKQFALELEWMP